jgi:hypothetical protein
LVRLGQQYLRWYQPSDAQKYLIEAKAILDQLEKDRPRTVEDADLLVQNQAMWYCLQGMNLAYHGKLLEAKAAMLEGTRRIDSLVHHQPKAFPFRLLQRDFLIDLIDIHSRLEEYDRAETLYNQYLLVEESLRRDSPQAAGCSLRRSFSARST